MDWLSLMPLVDLSLASLDPLAFGVLPLALSASTPRLLELREKAEFLVLLKPWKDLFWLIFGRRGTLVPGVNFLLCLTGCLRLSFRFSSSLALNMLRCGLWTSDTYLA